MRKLKFIFYTVFIFFTFTVTAQPTASEQLDVKAIQVIFKNHQLTLINESDKAINLANAIIQFQYVGKVFNAELVNNKTFKLRLLPISDTKLFNGKEKVYRITIQDELILPPQKSIKFQLTFDGKDVPHGFEIKSLFEVVPVKVSVSNANWVETISICNTSKITIPLTNIEFDFNYDVRLQSSIWGNPWVAWKLVSQNGSQVILEGGTPWSPSLPPDPDCKNPLTIQFNAPPTAPAPREPFVFKAQGVPSNQTGSANLTLQSIPAAGLPNPVITLQGTGGTYQQTLSWGNTWHVDNLTPGTYTVTGTDVNNDQQFYTLNPITMSVLASQTATQNITYSAVPTTSVTVTLVNAPKVDEPIQLSGHKYSLAKTVHNNSVLNLPGDTYTITANEVGYTVSATPNPLVTPDNKSLNIVYTATNQSSARTINFVNQCPFPVWFGFISGATPNRGGGTCNTDADCYPGSTCVNRGAGGNQCFWKNPTPANNNFKLEASGGTNNVQIPIYQNGLNYIWSGAIAGRTKCTGTGCETGDCGGGTGACPAGRGFQQPATQAEITMGINNPDYYDVEVINGMNLPVQMSPVISNPPSANPYNCGNPGSATAFGTMGACSWNMSPPAVEYHWVRAGGNSCKSNTDCATPNVCGLSFNPGKNPLLQKTCGVLIGYWTANQVCGIQNNYGAPFNCGQTLPPPQQNLTLNNLYQCTQVGSCYQNGADSTCCGCANWDQLGIPVPDETYTQQCVNSNPNWTNGVLPTLEWIKQACPSVYTYPYDDMSSTFTCQINDSTNRNSTNYTVTFCPGGETGGVTGS